MLDRGVMHGRSSSSDVRLLGQSVSRRQAGAARLRGVFVLTGLGSVNGAFVNGQRVHRKRLRDGDEVQLGRGRLAVHARSGAQYWVPVANGGTVGTTNLQELATPYLRPCSQVAVS